MTQYPDVAVIGAGIVGAACAAELAGHGLTVEVIDQMGIGCGTTGAGMGHLVVMDDSPAEFALSKWSVELWRELAGELAPQHGYRPCGTLWIATDDDELQAARARLARLQAAGIACHILDEQQLRACEPALRLGLPGALLAPGDGVVYPPAVAAWLLSPERPWGRRLRTRLGQTVVALHGNCVRLANGEVIRAGAIVLANGMGATEFVAGLPLAVKKGHLLITDRYPENLRHQVLELGYLKSAHQSSGASVAFNVQARPTGQLLIGSSRQFDELDPALDPAILGRMLRRAAEFLPALPSLHAIRAWTGFRAASRDGLPLIGQAHAHADAPWLAVGHEGLGVTTSLATAKLITAQMLNLMPEIPAAPYLPARFLDCQAAYE